MRRLVFTLITTLLAISTVVAAPNKKVAKEVKSQTKALSAEGWKVDIGAPALEEQVLAVAEHSAMVDTEGVPLYIIVTATKSSMSPNAAVSMAMHACKALATQEILKALGAEGSNSEKSIVLGRGKRLLYLQREKSYKNEAMITIAYNRKENLAANSHLVEKK